MKSNIKNNIFQCIAANNTCPTVEYAEHKIKFDNCLLMSDKAQGTDFEKNYILFQITLQKTAETYIDDHQNNKSA